MWIPGPKPCGWEIFEFMLSLFSTLCEIQRTYQVGQILIWKALFIRPSCIPNSRRSCWARAGAVARGSGRSSSRGSDPPCRRRPVWKIKTLFSKLYLSICSLGWGRWCVFQKSVVLYNYYRPEIVRKERREHSRRHNVGLGIEAQVQAGVPHEEEGHPWQEVDLRGFVMIQLVDK